MPFAARVGSLTESTEPRPIVFSKTDCSDVDAVLKLMFFTNSKPAPSPVAVPMVVTISPLRTKIEKTP